MSLRVWLRSLAASKRRGKRLEELGEAVTAHLNVLPIAGAQLRDANRRVEQAVVQVGANFGRMVESAREGADQASRLVGAGGESADGSSAGVGGLLSSSRTALEGLLSRIVEDSTVCRRLVERMDELERDMGGIVRALADVDRISFGNTILALNAKIEAAHIGEQGQGFELVAQELWTQSQRSGQITEQIRSSIVRLAGGAKAAVKDIGGMACADQARIEALQAQVHQALDRLKSAHEETAQALADGDARNEALAAEISAAVQAMQFQDRVSQQITHIVEALEAMQQAITAPLGEGDSPAGRAPAADLLSISYTMDGERSVHAAILGEEPAGQTADDVEIF
jgi:methyl-accepting chemotaxis protein